MNIQLDGKLIVITGASSGIGFNLALHLVHEGATVAFCYKSNDIEADKLYGQLLVVNPHCYYQKLDVSDEISVQRFLKEVQDKYEKIDILINNAGVCDDSLVGLMRTSQWETVINTNLNGTFYFCKYTTRMMISRRAGKIFNITSSRALNGTFGQANYCASKAGIYGLTRTLARELGPYNIMVNAINPPYIKTNLNKDKKRSEFKEKTAKQMSVLQSQGSFETINHFFSYACSDLFSGISGQLFTLDSRLE